MVVCVCGHALFYSMEFQHLVCWAWTQTPPFILIAKKDTASRFGSELHLLGLTFCSEESVLFWSSWDACKQMTGSNKHENSTMWKGREQNGNSLLCGGCRWGKIKVLKWNKQDMVRGMYLCTQDVEGKEQGEAETSMLESIGLAIVAWSEPARPFYMQVTDLVTDDLHLWQRRLDQWCRRKENLLGSLARHFQLSNKANDSHLLCTVTVSFPLHLALGKTWLANNFVAICINNKMVYYYTNLPKGSCSQHIHNSPIFKI